MPASKSIHPLQRAGASQNQRNLPALSTSYALLDERSEADLLEYVWNLAKVVIYHDVQHNQLWKSDWLDFLRLSLPIQLALIGNFDIERSNTEFQQALENFENGLGRNRLEPLFEKTADLALLLNRWHKNLPESTPLRTDLEALIRNDLHYALIRFIRLLNDAQQQLSAHGFQRPQLLAPLAESPVWDITASDLLVSGLNLPNGAKAKGSLQDKRAFYRDQLIELYRTFWQGLRRIVQLANTDVYRQKSLAGVSENPAHIGLLVAFTRMFKILQNDLNRIPERHFEFYLRDVLGLKALPAVPDTAHLVVELDKNFQKHLIPAGKKIKAGPKDTNKADIIFAPSEEALLNQASVDILHSLYRQTNAGKLEALYTASGADAYDGKVEPFPEPEKTKWKTLGAKESPNKAINEIARVGFFVASPALLLLEGNALVKLAIDFTGTLPNNLSLTHLFNVYYSGEKGWIDARSFTHGTMGFSVSVAGNTLSIQFAVEAGKPLVFADSKALKIDYGTTDPMVKLELRQPANPQGWEMFDALCRINLTNITITLADVALRNLLVSNDEGPVDPNKPFLPFGAMPKIGASLIVGSEEAFRKNLSGFKFQVTWDKLPAGSFTAHYAGYPTPLPQNADFKGKFSGLINGVWSPFPPTHELPLFPSIPKAEFILKPPITVGKPSGALQPYSNLSESGFVKMELSGRDFMHDIFPEVLATKMIAIANKGIAKSHFDDLKGFLDQANAILDQNEPQIPLGNNPTADLALANQNITDANNIINDGDNKVENAIAKLIEIGSVDLPNPPYTPTIREFTLVYSATETWSGGQLRFGHLHPFDPQNHEVKLYTENPTLLPAITVNPDVSTTIPPNLEGSLYIGLKKLMPGSTLNLLFQMAEATANPDIELQNLSWWYLAGNNWHKLRPDMDILEDATQHLTASGLLRFSLPLGISSIGTTILPSDRHWLRVTLAAGVQGVADTVAVHAQAIRATAILSPENNTSRLLNPLPGGSLGKAIEAEAALKKIGQPYESFGGRPEEAGTVFHLRAAERMRHKGRSITLFDYERIVLQAFPQIYKVKCLPHTRPLPGNVLHTAAPGYVTLVVIPDITQFSFAEKMQPKASRALLETIERYLMERSTPFVRIKVVNPIYQLINVQAEVVFEKGKDILYYQNQLREDVIRFLTPWAFGELDRLSFGGKVFQSSILHFAEKLDYVDYLINFKLSEPNGDPKTVIEAQTERSILAYGDAKWHTPADLCPPNPKDPAQEGLGYKEFEIKNEPCDD